MIIGIDIGNTTTEIGFLRSETLIKSYKLKTDRGKTQDDWFLDFYQILGIESFPEAKDFVVSSVVPAVEDRIGKAVEKISGKKAIFIGKDIKVPITNRYRNPEEVGIDRLVNSFAVVKKYGYPSIVIDFGTAVTFDVINEKAEYVGGAIFPGIDASIEALFSKTAKLPSVNLQTVNHIVGKTTSDSIKSGIFNGYLSMVEGIVEKINKEAGYKHRVIITGGNGKLISEGLKIDFVYDEFLSMEGIYFVYTEYKKG
ncbi:MAG TPA: type III pantothenate kinase [Persephonella sp.]|nr:type III pantothenate kinase [Persephonella sp.]